MVDKNGRGNQNNLVLQEVGNMRHHYIPQWLLRNFQDSNEKIYAFVKSNPERGVFATTPKNLMVEKDLYTLRGKSGPTRQAVEEWFSRIEADEKPVVDKIITAVRNDTKPGLTREDNLICHHFRYSTHVRTPDIAAEIDVLKMPLVIDAFLEWNQKIGNLNAHDMEVARDFFHDPDHQKEWKHDSHVMAVAAPPTPGVMQDIKTQGLRIARIAKPNKSFVIGSYALALVTYGGASYAWLPISHDVAVQLFGPAGTETLEELKQDHIIRAINEASFRQSSIVAARSEQLLCSLAKRIERRREPIALVAMSIFLGADGRIRYRGLTPLADLLQAAEAGLFIG